MKCHIRLFNVLLFLVTVLTNLRFAQCDETTVKPPILEPPFPDLFDPFRTDASATGIKIVSETTDATEGYKVVTEYIDTELARVAYVTHRKGNESFVLVNGVADVIYSYKPYTCKTVDVSQLGSLTVNEWTTDLTLNKQNAKGEDLEINLHLFGVLGFWLYASRMPKVHSGSSAIFSVSKNRYMISHKWFVNDVNNGIRIEMYFVDIAPEKAEKPILSLEVVKVLFLDDNMKIWSTYNVLSVDYGFEQEAYDSFLQIPIGYGCLSDITETQFEEQRSFEVSKLAMKHSLNHRKLNLEITATKFFHVEGEATSKSSHTINIEVARRWDVYLMLRTRGAVMDMKQVVDFKNYVQYEVDMRKGTCKISHYRYDLENMASPISIKFNNGLYMNLTLETLVDLFDLQVDFRYIRTTKQQDGVAEYVYFEKVKDMDVFNTGSPRPTRVIRKYLMDANEYSLESVAIWLMKQDETQIDELFEIHVIDVQPLQDHWYSLPKVYDVSEECYLQNKQMKNGRDYAWLEFKYPISSSEEKIWMLGHTDPIEAALHKRFANYFRANSIRLPRIELRFEEESLNVRLLLLDYPPLEMMFAKLESTVIDFVPGQDYEDIAIDIKHCAELCRIQHCHLMSYCESNRKCLYSRRAFGMRTEFVKRTGCETYMDTSHDYRDNLQYIISKTRHLDFGPVSLPEPSEELLRPRSETGISYARYHELIEDYRKDVLTHIKKEKSDLAHLAVLIELNNRPTVLVPSDFNVEINPIKDLALIDSDAPEDDYDRSPAFRKGIANARYKPEGFDLKSKRNAILFKDLTYDQCALACVDNGCSSFSYCRIKKDCLVTTVIFNNSISLDPQIIDDKSQDCLIMQRDFLSNFDAFANAYRAQVYEKKSTAQSESECAYACVAETSFRCLAFDFCSSSNAKSVCLFQSTRHQTNTIAKADTLTAKPVETGCTHYSRSFLADFTDIPYIAINDELKAQLTTNRVAGESVFECATRCTMDSQDCNAFEFCFNAMAIGKQQAEALQTCELMKLTRSELDKLSVLNEKGKTDEQMGIAKLFTSSQNCHIYILRQDSVEAQLKDMSISSETLFSKTEAKRLAASKSRGFRFGSGMLLYVCVVLLSIGAGSAICVARENELVMQKVERLRIVLRI